MELVISDLSYGFKEPLCSDINIRCSQGTVCVFMGSNGLGKSTLFRTIAGILEPMKGRVECVKGGRDEPKIVFVGTARPMVEMLTVQDYLSFGNNDVVEEAEILLNRFSIRDCKNRMISELSDGQYKKIALIRQLLKHPDVLLLDEPSAHLDVENKSFLVSVLKELKQELVILLTTHDLDFAKKVGDEFFELKERKLTKITRSFKA